MRRGTSALDEANNEQYATAENLDLLSTKSSAPAKRPTLPAGKADK